SEARALTNITGNAVATVVISASENELDRERMALALNGKLDDEVALVPELSAVEPALVPAR
ncbi:MAG: C4-dicarboxylate transporter DctA, partial [Zoogloea sp.]|nr:C4-dicarboxylate transporter DctA [Zoogloea sp.]